MTDDTPERIWAMTPDIGEYWAEPPVNPEDHLFLTEYLRADLATRQRDEAVGAAWLDGFAQGEAHKAGFVEMPGPPDDATTALAARDAETWNAAIEAAAQAYYEGAIKGGDVAWDFFREADQAIRALKKELPNAD